MFEGKKWRVKEEVLVFNKDPWADAGYELKPVFGMTKAYANYLRAKREKELKDKIMCMKDKLEFQKQKYGEVDPVDLSEFMYLVKQAQAL